MAPGNQYITGTAAYSTTVTSQPPDRPAPIMDIALDDLQGLLALLANTHQRVRGIADRLLGGEPSPIGADGKSNPEVVPITIRLSNALREAHAIGEAIRHQVERLESL